MARSLFFDSVIILLKLEGLTRRWSQQRKVKSRKAKVENAAVADLVTHALPLTRPLGLPIHVTACQLVPL